jgi:hypothetical protein
VPPFHVSRYLGARLLLDIERIEADTHKDRSFRAAARRNMRTVVTNSGKIALTRVDKLQLAGRFEWREQRYKESLAYFERSITAAEALGAPLSRARSFGVLADLLAEPGSGPKRFRDLDASACRAEARSGMQAVDSN